MRAAVYLKGSGSVEVDRPEVALEDLFDVACADTGALERIRQIRVLTFPEEGSREVVSVLQVIRMIHGEYPEAEVQNIGESDLVVTYRRKHRGNKVLRTLKVAAVFLLAFTGAAFSIMAFNNDVDTSTLFSQLYTLFTGRDSDGFTILEFTYCVGLVIGILLFFNHFGRRRFSMDPTPIEVEMRTYENEIQSTLVEMWSRKERGADKDAADRDGAPGA